MSMYQIFNSHSYQNVSGETVLSGLSSQSAERDAPNLMPQQHDKRESIHLTERICHDQL